MIVQLKHTEYVWVIWKGRKRKNMVAQLADSKLHMNKPQRLLEQTDNVQMFVQNAQQHFWRKPSSAHQHKDLRAALSTVEEG